MRRLNAVSMKCKKIIRGIARRRLESRSGGMPRLDPRKAVCGEHLAIATFGFQ